jgi:hypothetical protein
MPASLSITIIDSNIFKGCTGLTSVTISNGVTTIKNDAFNGCSSLTSITIPSKVDYIDMTAFAGCTSLTDVTCEAVIVPETSSDAFQDCHIENVTLHVPAAAFDEYKQAEPWKDFGKIVRMVKCAKPTISYANDEITFGCETEGISFSSEITDDDVKKHSDGKISLTKTYIITVYATKDGFENSDVATATLTWIDVVPGAGDITTQVAEVKAYPVLITSNGGLLTLTGVPVGTPITVYNLSGQNVGSATATAGTTQVITTLSSGAVAIVKIGEKSVKVMVK